MTPGSFFYRPFPPATSPFPWKRAALAMAAGAATVALLSAAFPPFNRDMVVWLAFVPLLLVLPSLSWRGVEWMGFLLGFAFYGLGFRWLYGIFGFPAVSLWGLLALFFAAFCALVRSLPATMKWWQRAPLIACFWVVVEFVRCEQWPLRFSWLALGYSQHRQPAVLPAAAFIGVYGISFLIVLTNAVLAEIYRPRLSALGGLVFLIGMFMVGKPAAIPTMEDPHGLAARMVAVQSDHANVDALLRLSREAGVRRSVPTLLVWPEYAVQQTPREDPETWLAVANAAKTMRATLVLCGLTDKGQDATASTAFVFSPAGALLGTYDKHNPLPLMKDGEPGHSFPVFPWRIGNRAVPFGVLICYDLSFEANARAAVRSGAQFLVVPSTEPPEWGALMHAQHAIVAPLRAVEEHRGILRVSNIGPSQVVEPNGCVRETLPVGAEGALVSSPVTRETDRTVYNRVGWLLPWLCQGVTAAWLLRLLARNGRRKRERTPSY